MSDPLASLRAELKAGKTNAAAPSKSDPLAALRARVKAGKSLTSGSAKTAKPTAPTDTRLSRLEYTVGILTAHLGLPPLAQD